MTVQLPVISALEPRPHPEGPTTLLLLLAATALGAATRLLPLIGTFPLRDGGLFYVMIRNLAAHHFLLPDFTTYNRAHIPFAYPPFGLYFTAALHAVTGLPLLTLLRVVPFGVSVLAIPAFYLLARALLPGPVPIIATFLFAILPESYSSEIQGGGVTRAFGLLFALLALSQIALLCRKRNERHMLPAAVFCALTLLSHLEWTWFVAYSSVVFALTLRPSPATGLRLAGVAAGAALLTAPWWLLVMARYGTGIFLVTVQGSAHVFPWYLGLTELLQLDLTNEIWFPLATALALLGIIGALRRREWLLPVWLLVLFTVESRGTSLRSVVPVSLLAAVGLYYVVLPLLRDALSRRALAGVLALGLAWLTVTGMLFETSVSDTLRPQDQAALHWVRVHTTGSARFLVITSKYWAYDDVSEWFPALTHRVSVATVQGYEWIPGGFARQFGRDQAAQRCSTRGAGCLLTWFHHYHLVPGYVYVSVGRPSGPATSAGLIHDDCCRWLRAALTSNPHFTRVFQGTGAAIYRVRGVTS